MMPQVERPRLEDRRQFKISNLYQSVAKRALVACTGMCLRIECSQY